MLAWTCLIILESWPEYHPTSTTPQGLQNSPSGFPHHICCLPLPPMGGRRPKVRWKEAWSSHDMSWDYSHHQDVHMFGLGDPELNLHLWHYHSLLTQCLEPPFQIGSCPKVSGWFVFTLRNLAPQKWLFWGNKNNPAIEVQTLPLEGRWGFVG